MRDEIFAVGLGRRRDHARHARLNREARRLVARAPDDVICPLGLGRFIALRFCCALGTKLLALV